MPFLLAGGGEKTTLRQVARFADASNMGAHPAIGQAVSDDDIARKFDTLKSWCEEYGRPYESVLRTHFTMPLVLAPTRAALETKLARIPHRHARPGTPTPSSPARRKRPSRSTEGLPRLGSSTSSPTPWAVTRRRSSCSARR